jgi:hypothetical protein
MERLWLNSFAMKGRGISSATIFCLICFLAAFVSVLIGFIAERIARSKLPPEMQTPEAIQYYYDGAVCLTCEFGGWFVGFLFVAIGIVSVILSPFVNFIDTKEDFDD